MARNDYDQLSSAIETTDSEEFAKNVIKALGGIPIGENAREIYNTASNYLDSS